MFDDMSKGLAVVMVAVVANRALDTVFFSYKGGGVLARTERRMVAVGRRNGLIGIRGPRAAAEVIALAIVGDRHIYRLSNDTFN